MVRLSDEVVLVVVRPSSLSVDEVEAAVVRLGSVASGETDELEVSCNSEELVVVVSEVDEFVVVIPVVGEDVISTLASDELVTVECSLIVEGVSVEAIVGVSEMDVVRETS